ncbi:hypothetical protein N7509_005248 [Penicillium cosmopolitanum]|uniref:Rho-GAP domain-containing protein n=1 Tax=Penicillium cosmopolitanum TaxID=1131564 RepID=A0A9W9W206_9EURO|nr:uncharacterized protein N7509_005248 [Penicillium cosmopolitanum]KAJ5397135.1 hypothetical protein N7509_005248 [Penicillium cosmopolitanum]
MADSVLPEPTALPALSDAPPSSAGRESGHSGALDQHQPQPQPQPQAAISDELKARLDKIVNSEIGITTLLSRLKQSVASAQDFSSFLKKRGSLEEEHAQGLRKLSRAVNEAAQRNDNRQGTYSSSYKDIHRLHERMADHGLQFAVSLQQMSDDLRELSANIERSRKQWKQTGLAAEKKVTDAESQAEKAKAKYESLAEQLDRVRTGEKSGGKFGLKGHKSGAQHEEELTRKVETADGDYKTKVQAAQAARRELLSMHRPQTVLNLQQLISECDSGLTLQQQKFATFNEKLLLGQGLCVSPMKTDGASSIAPKSLAEVVRQVDNEKDLHEYILSHEGNEGAVAGDEVKYEPHPTLGGGASTSSQPSTLNKRQSVLPQTFSTANISSPATQPPQSTTDRFQPPSYQAQPEPTSAPPSQPPYPSSGPPPQQPPSQVVVPMAGPPPMEKGGYQTNLPPLKPVFGVSLEDLYARDGTAVPFLVYQCFQAVELFGLDMEGIYRLSGSANHISHMKAVFDNDSSQVDFTNPENFYHDVNSVAGLAKQFFRDLPDPLFTSQYYTQFVDAARIDDDIQRRDSLHALINSLPDAHYATLRAIILHLNKVQEHYTQNRMNAGNLAICFGPTLMGANSGGNIADAGWQVRVIETILNNTFQIFDDD